MSVIHCWNRCIDMFYNCVIFVILNKRRGKKEEINRIRHHLCTCIKHDRINKKIHENVSMKRENIYTETCIWLSAKRCVCNGWLGCAENKSCLIFQFLFFFFFFGHDCGLNVCENEWGYSWNNCSRNFEAVWEICLIKCDFTAEIQPRKTDSGTEPVSVGVVWLKKTSKSYIYHIYHVWERSFYKIHESERLPLNYAFVKSISNFVWSDDSDPWHERKWRHMHVRLAVNHFAALKFFNQTTFVVLTKFAAPQILLQ